MRQNPHLSRPIGQVILIQLHGFPRSQNVRGIGGSDIGWSGIRSRGTRDINIPSVAGISLNENIRGEDAGAGKLIDATVEGND